MDNVHNIDFTQTLGMHVIANITTKQSHYNEYTIIQLLLCVPIYCDRANIPARSSRARAGPGPHILNCFAGRVGPGHTCCGPGRARAS